MSFASEGIDYQNVIVNKPWGYEYLMYDNGEVSLWQLFIRHHQRTSLHCHPHKKTGIILLSGEAQVSFLNDARPLHPLGKLMIREGLFHSTMAVSEEGIVVIETETPSDKTNLVRLDDEYGRQEKPYEGSEAVVPLNESCVRLTDPDEGKVHAYPLAGSLLAVERVSDAQDLLQRPPGDIVVVLKGGLMSRQGDPVLSCGDVVSSETVSRLAKTFVAPLGITFLSVRKQG